MGTHLPCTRKGAEPPIFGPFLLWPHGWMHQGATWYGGRPQPRRLCVRWGPSPLPKKGRCPQFSAHVYCGQTAAWVKMPLGTEVDLGPGDIVLGGDLTPPSQRSSAAPPHFSAHLLWHGRLSQQLLSSCYSLCCDFVTYFRVVIGLYSMHFYFRTTFNHVTLYTVFQQNWTTKLIAVTLFNLNRFSKLFHC